MKNLNSQIPHSKSTITSQDINAVHSCLTQGFITSGDLNNEFCEKFSKRQHDHYVKTFSSGTSALFWGLKSLLQGSEGGHILLPNYICSEVSKAVASAGFKPIYYDNSEASWISDFQSISSVVDTKTKAIIVNYTFGIHLDFLDKLLELDIPIIEDCCHAPFSEIGGKPIAKESMFSFYSFNATKYLASGEGGALTTSNYDFFKTVTDHSCDHGLSDLAASLLINQLEQLDFFREKRIELASIYKTELSDFKSPDLDQSIFFRYPIWHKNQNNLLSNSTVAFRKGVDQLNLMSNMPNSLATLKHTVSLPIYPHLKKTDIYAIIEEVKNSHGT